MTQDNHRKLHVMMLGIRGFPGIQGGCERHVEQLSRALVPLGCGIEVICRTAYIKKGEEARLPGITMTRLWSPAAQGPEALLHTIVGTFYAAVKRPDVLHIHSIGPGIVAPLARLLGVRVVVTHHGPDYVREKWSGFGRAVLKLGEFCSMRFSSEIIVISKKIRSLVEGKHGRTGVLIPNGVPLPELPDTTGALQEFGLEPKKYIALVAGFRAEKCHSDLIEAFGRAAPPGWKLVLVGWADPPDDYLKRTVAKAEATPNVICTGLQSGLALRELFAHAGLFVLPSSMEGLPIALLEALSYGLPVLASDIPEHLELELAKDRYFRQGDVEALARLLGEPETLAITPEEAKSQRSWVNENYNWEKIAQQTLAVYLSVARRGKELELPSTPEASAGRTTRSIL